MTDGFDCGPVRRWNEQSDGGRVGRARGGEEGTCNCAPPNGCTAQVICNDMSSRGSGADIYIMATRPQTERSMLRRTHPRCALSISTISQRLKGLQTMFFILKLNPIIILCSSPSAPLSASPSFGLIVFGF